LRETWGNFVSKLAVNFEPAQAIPALEKFSNEEFAGFQKLSETYIHNAHFRSTSKLEEGMNSPGILWDRLTILNCKYLFTSQDSVHHKPELHKNLGNVIVELESVRKALALAKPARNILLAKEATDRQREAAPLEESLWQLQMSNIAMWINQDLLYTVSADDVDPQRLRDYIKFFSKANRIRNTAIEHVEIYYSMKMQRN
jgi:hypothetical protein